MSLPEAEEVADLLLAGGGTDVLDEDGCGHVELIIRNWVECIDVLCCDVCEGEEMGRKKRRHGRQGGGFV
jgi:hypothetical protein